MYKGFRSSVATANRLISSRDTSRVQGGVSRPIQERISSVTSDLDATILLRCSNIDCMSQRSIPTTASQSKSRTSLGPVSGRSRTSLKQVSGTYQVGLALTCLRLALTCLDLP